MIIQTKVGPTEDPKEFAENFEKSMKYLQLEHVDLLSFHGINNDLLLDWVLRPGGCMEVARQWQKEGRVRFIGYSTHGTERVLTKANNTGEFDYFNVHWYYVNPLNWPSIEAAAKHDMGVFIISPTDKGGRLQEPPQKLVDLCAPLSPMQFNDLYCLSKPQVHTLSIGASKPTDFDEHVASLEHYNNIEETIAPIEARLNAEIDRVLEPKMGREWRTRWSEGLPEHLNVPDDMNIEEAVRLYTFSEAFDLHEWARGRYNLLGKNDHFFPGNKIINADNRVLEPVLAHSPFQRQDSANSARNARGA
jgi:predicted aldo/keto reductase-like oxidoreductase